jgi:hypothetical protein
LFRRVNIHLIHHSCSVTRWGLTLNDSVSIWGNCLFIQTQIEIAYLPTLLDLESWNRTQTTWKSLCQISWKSSHPTMFRFRNQYLLPVKCPFGTKTTLPCGYWSTISSYKEYNTRATLATLTDVKLKSAGVESQEDRKLVLAALRKAGCGYKSSLRKKVEASPSTEPSGSVSETTSSTSSMQPTAVEILVRRHSVSVCLLIDSVRRRRRPNVRENALLI